MSPAEPALRFLFLANTDWYLYNFRAPLLADLRARGIEIHVACPQGPWVPRLQELGFQWHALALRRRGQTLWSEWKTFRAIQRLQEQIQPHLTHHFTLQCVIWGSLATRKSAHPTVVVNALTGLGSVFRGKGLVGRLLRTPVSFLLRQALRTRGSATIFQNPEDLDLCQRLLGLDPRDLHLIRGSGVDPVRFAPTPRRLDNPVVLFVGRLLEDKGIRLFLQAAQVLSAKHPGWRFLVAGTTDPGNPTSLREAEVESLARSCPAIQFLGHHEDMASLMGMAHLLVLPTRYGEGVPRSLIEGAASGLPLVASDHPGCREIVRHGLNGALVGSERVADWVEAIASVLSDPVRWEAMSAESRRLAASEFSERAVLDATWSVYRKALPRLGGPTPAHNH